MNPYLLPTFEFGPAIIQRVLRHVPESRWDERIEAGRFTIREAVAHLADWEPIWLARFEVGVDNPGGRVPAYDIEVLAAEHDYSLQDVHKKAERFIYGRHVLCDFLRTMSPEQFNNTIDHPERGIMTLEEMGNMILGHDMYHIEHLTLFLD